MSDDDLENLPPTTAPSVSLSVKGFANTEAAEALGNAVGGFVVHLGSFIDLSTLDAITIAVDYDAALAEVDRGMEGLRPLDRSNTEAMQGVAKSCVVLRDGVEKTHLIFNAAMLVPLILEEETTEEDLQTALAIVAHECGHVQFNALNSTTIPDLRLGVTISDYERAILIQGAEVCWEEYAVCRLTADFAPNQNAQHADV